VHVRAIEVVVDKLKDLLSNFFVGGVVFHSVVNLMCVTLVLVL
jgi:hypothetical protein